MSYRLILEDDHSHVDAEDFSITDLNLALAEALSGFREILGDHLKFGEPCSLKKIHVAGPTGIVASVGIEDALAGIVVFDGPELLKSA